MKRILLALLVLTSISVAAQDAVILRVNYNEGDAYILNVETNTSMGISGFMNSKMTMDMTVPVVKDGLFETVTKLTYIKMDVEQGGISMSYDTGMNAEELDDMGQMMKSQLDPMMNSMIYITFDTLGTKVETRVEPSNAAGLEQLTQSSGSIIYPLEKVSVGSTWTSKEERQGMIMNIIYTVSSIADGTAILDVSGDMSGIGTGTLKGNTSIDITSGVQKDSDLQLTVSSQGIDISTTVKTTMTKV